ncbi:serine hydrolase [Endozoicomonas lisbonensis]|uniref:D-alanyl-D-alanine carboxypeptidase n=1 Tax=Endozoicomonas lisbonensis TaxID=3120522 RepID=A0ABV2SH49_9GAMM
MIPDAPAINAKGYVLMDYESGEIIASSNPDEELAPASLTKMMTAYVIGQEINNGRLAFDDTVTIRQTAWPRNFPDSSKMFIEPSDEISVANLSRGIMVQSGKFCGSGRYAPDFCGDGYAKPAGTSGRKPQTADLWFRFFESTEQVKIGEALMTEKLWMGKDDMVELTVAEDIFTVLPRGAAKKLDVEYSVETPIKAPIEAGQALGTVSLDTG